NVAEMFATVFMLLGIALAPLSVVSAVLQAMPLTVTLAAAVFLREPVGWRRWSAILVGFFGVLLILRPGLSGYDPYALLPLGAVVMLTFRDIATRRVPDGVASLQLSGWGFTAVIPGGFLMLALQGEAPMMPGAADWGLQVLVLLAAILGYSALVLATRGGDIGLTTPFRYSRLVFGMAIGVVVFGERPDALMLVGAALVVAAGLYTLMREMRLRRRVVRG
ncbi:MAG: DMT family transporter, partial [Pararhodobacter sp.]|nr:DMT family transporter [Pararhodobacter sp.]